MAEPESDSVNQQPSSSPSAGGETVTPIGRKEIKLFGDGKFVESGRVLPWLVLAAVLGTLTWVAMDAWSLTWQEVEVSQTPSAFLNHRARRPPAFADTSGWKTYRNETYGFSFRYPKEFTPEEYNDKSTVVLAGKTGKIEVTLVGLLPVMCLTEEVKMKKVFGKYEWVVCTNKVWFTTYLNWDIVGRIVVKIDNSDLDETRNLSLSTFFIPRIAGPS